MMHRTLHKCFDLALLLIVDKIAVKPYLLTVEFCFQKYWQSILRRREIFKTYYIRKKYVFKMQIRKRNQGNSMIRKNMILAILYM